MPHDLPGLLVDRLRQEHRLQSWLRFGSVLPVPAIRLTDARTVLAAWSTDTRTLEVSQALLLEVPWGSVVEVLKHEMAHQFVQEVLRVDEPPHGPAFRRVCEQRGIDPSAHGVPAGREAGDEAIDRVREKVRRLLALAGSSNPHEAELAMLRAREILLRHNVQLGAVPARYEVRWLGTPRRRVPRAEYVLGGILADHFHVEILWTPTYVAAEGYDATVLEVMGTAGNVDMAEYVHAFLLHTSEALWKGRRAQVGGRARQAFLAGVMRGFRDKLDAQRATLTGSGLVWVGDGALRAWFERRHPRTRTISGASTSSHWGAHAAGRVEGGRIVLSRPMTSGPSGGTRLLPSGD